MRLLSLVLILFLLFPPMAFSFKKSKKKQNSVQKEKMVETVEEWEVKAQDVPLEDRKLEETDPPKTDKKNYFPKAHYNFELYNFPQGSKSYDIRFIKKNLVEHPIIVSDLTCHYVAYTNYYYRIDTDQIYSDFYVEKLDTSKTKTDRVLDFRHRQLKRTPVLLSGFNEEYRHLFNGLTLVDWSQDSNKVLIKENIGSTVNGIYKTNLYVYFLDQKKLIRLSNFEDAISEFYLEVNDLPLNQVRYVIEPLGFSSNNDNLVVVRLYVYSKQGDKIFLGIWGYDLEENNTLLLTKTSTSYPVSSNGLVLKRVLE